MVSTHSRPKAAGSAVRGGSRFLWRFNTQPPEGGWVQFFFQLWCVVGFNTQPPEGGWDGSGRLAHSAALFQHTAARRRLAGKGDVGAMNMWFQHTAARRRLAQKRKIPRLSEQFQHTAARRRLAADGFDLTAVAVRVSTHSRPKAAGAAPARIRSARRRFNTQPPEGGWSPNTRALPHTQAFQHTAARRRLVLGDGLMLPGSRFNTQPPEGGWSLSQKPCSIRFRSPNFAKLSRKA